MDERFELTCYIMPNSQVETNLNENWWLPPDLFQNGKVISKSSVEFSNDSDKDEIGLALNSSEKTDIIRNFFAIYSDSFAKLAPMTGFFNVNNSRELEYVNLHFIKMAKGYNYPAMRGFLNYINKNGFVPDSDINIPKKGYDLGLPERTQRGGLTEPEVNEIGNLALLVNWNFIFENELVNIPQKYDSRVCIMKNHKYDEQHLFSMCVPSLTPLDRAPVFEAYEKLKNK